MTPTHLFADRVNAIKPSAIREIFALLKRPGIISFAGGWPDPALFPVQAIDDIAHDVLQSESGEALQYGATAGDARLLAWLRGRMADRYGMTVADNEIMITSGAQQGIYLTCSLLLNPGDVLVTEAPTFVGAFGAMQTFQAQMIGVAMDQDGLDTHALEALLQTQRIKFVYTIPEFQNPSGLTMTLARRHELIRLAARYDFMILEDSPYSELRYAGEPLPPIYALDPHGRTIYLGSFSKTFAPLRIGWLCGPAAVVQKLVASKMAIDVCTPALTQAILYHFCACGLLDEQIDTIRAAYKRKRDLMLGALDRHMPAGVEWTAPDGGMFVWLTLPAEMNARDLFFRALAHDVAFVTGDAFYPQPELAPRNVLRLTFVTPPEEQIVVGIERLGRVLQ